MDNNKMIYSEEELDINKQHNAKMKIVDLMLLRFRKQQVHTLKIRRCAAMHKHH